MSTANGVALSEVLGISSRMQFHGEVSDEELISPLSLGESLALVSNRTVELSVDFATRLLQLPEFVVNDATVDRNLRDAHVAYLVSCMRRGLFRPEWVAVIDCECEEELPPNPPFSTYRMNGQHTAWARIEYARVTGNADYRCAVRHMRYKAKTVADMRVLYTSIDRGAPRTAGNVINAYLAGTEMFADAPRAVISLLAAGLTFWLNKPIGSMDPDTKAVLMQTEYKDVTVAVKNWLIAPGRRNPDVWGMFKRAPVCAALYETFSKLPSRAHEFWDVVSSGLGVELVTDPRYRLRERLKGASLHGKNSKKELTAQADMYSWCINSWNAWRGGKELQAIKGTYGQTRPKAK